MLIFLGLWTVQDPCVQFDTPMLYAHRSQIKLTKDGSVLLKEMVRRRVGGDSMLTEIANPKPHRCPSPSIFLNHRNHDRS